MHNIRASFTAILQLIRYKNLLIIGLCQSLVYGALMPFFMQKLEGHISLSATHFIWLMLSTMLMAAFGNTINDIYDMATDSINKSDAPLVRQSISRRQAIGLSVILLSLSLGMAIWVCWQLHIPTFALLHVAIAVGLWLYAWRLKAAPLIGNVLVSLFTALSIAIVGLYEWGAHATSGSLSALLPMWVSIGAYAGFAFLLNTMRELIKDIEDMAGDSACHMRTFAIVAGVKTTKIVIGSLGVVALLLLVAGIDMLLIMAWSKLLAVYLSVMVLVPLGVFLLRMQKSELPTDFTYLSHFAKLIMLSGVLSMLMFLL